MQKKTQPFHHFTLIFRGQSSSFLFRNNYLRCSWTIVVVKTNTRQRFQFNESRSLVSLVVDARSPTLRRWEWSFQAFAFDVVKVGAPPSRLKHWSSIAKKLLRSGVLRLATGSSLNSSKLQQRDYQQPQQTTKVIVKTSSSYFSFEITGFNYNFCCLLWLLVVPLL